MLRITDVHKSYGKLSVLKGVSLDVNKGDVVVILGPSGSGKTTFLRTINFLEIADRGEIEFDTISTPFKSASKKTILQLRKKTAFVFQNYNLFNNKTAIENVMEGLVTARKIPKKKAEEIAKKALDKVGLSERYNYYPASLSGGQQQRVGIARAFAIEPDVILFDEPTSALDPELIGDVLKIMKELAKEGTTMIVVTHEMNFAQDVATKIVFMDGGRILEESTPSEFFVKPKTERAQKFLRRILPTPEDSWVI